MGKLTLKANGGNEKILLDYLEANASDELVEKINKGDKTLTGCWNQIMVWAKQELKNRSGALADSVVFGWAVHYFEEDSIKENKTEDKKAKVVAPVSKETKEEIKKAVDSYPGLKNDRAVKREAEKVKTEVIPIKKAEPKAKKQEDATMNIFDFFGGE